MPAGKTESSLRPTIGWHGGQRCWPLHRRSGRGSSDSDRQNPVGELIAVVAGKQFIAAIAGQCHRDMAARHCGNEICRNLGRVRKWLVVHVGQLRNDVERLLRGHREFGVIGSKMTGDRSRMWSLIKAGQIEADRVGPDGAAICGLHQRDDGGGIDAAGQESANRHVGHHAAAHSVLQQYFETVRQFAIVACNGSARPACATARASQKRSIRGSPSGGRVSIVPGSSLCTPL